MEIFKKEKRSSFGLSYDFLNSFYFLILNAFTMENGEEYHVWGGVHDLQSFPAATKHAAGSVWFPGCHASPGAVK